ncbi:M20 family metallo-hydrolase [Virgibacillus halophilus]|uniref:M20 family metallo-hydrolase n=1 Tax=Tigheibacillus halophilus TaxID=361280 RepID=UPI003638AFE4
MWPTDTFLQDKLLKNYDPAFDREGLSGKRVAKRFNELARIGLTAENGSNRPGYTSEEREAKRLVSGWMRQAGLAVREDGAGNIFGILEGKNPDIPAIVAGSHVDSVPNGGHFDGTLGVIAAMEVAEAWLQTGFVPERNYEIAVFSDEEGARFNGGLNGSEAVTGNYELAAKRQLRDSQGLSFREVLEQNGLDEESYVMAKRAPDDISLYVETHIEQGKRLEKADLPCGIVTGIAGPCWIEFTFTGEAGHAGNTPMSDRKDALVAASTFVTAVNKLPATFSETAVATVGKQEISPNGVNVIPGAVTLYVDIRDIHLEARDALVAEIKAAAEEIAKDYDVKVSSKETLRVEPVPIAEETQQLLADALEELGIKPFRLPSGAGHDAMIIGAMVPIAMLFTKSRDGISHSPEEWSDLNDCMRTIHVMQRFIEKSQ